MEDLRGNLPDHPQAHHASARSDNGIFLFDSWLLKMLQAVLGFLSSTLIRVIFEPARIKRRADKAARGQVKAVGCQVIRNQTL